MRRRSVSSPAALPSTLRPGAAALVAIAALLVAGLGARYARTGVPGPLDTRAQAMVVELVPSSVAAWAYPIDLLGSPPLAVLAFGLVTLLCLAGGWRRLAAVSVAGPGCTGILTTFIKPVAGRTINGNNLCFPSGHTAAATAFGLVAALLLARAFRLGPRGTVGLVVLGIGVFGAGMGLTQVALGAHYATDAVAGGGTAISTVLGLALLTDLSSDWMTNRPAAGRPQPSRAAEDSAGTCGALSTADPASDDCDQTPPGRGDTA